MSTFASRHLLEQQLERVLARGSRHVQIEQDHVRPQGLRAFHAVEAVGSLPDHLEVRLCATAAP